MKFDHWLIFTVSNLYKTTNIRLGRIYEDYDDNYKRPNV